MISRLLFVTVLIFARATFAATLAEGDAKFDKHLYDEALKSYAQLAKDGKGETKWKATYRAAECEALLFRFGEAAARAHDAELPPTPLWKARFLLLRAELGREFVKQYGYGAPKERDEGSRDLTKRTPAEWHADIRQSFEALWALRAILLTNRIEDEGYFVDLEKGDLPAAPTFFDLVVSRWTEYLVSEAPNEDGEEELVEPFLAIPFKGTVSPKESPLKLAAAVFEAAFDAGGKNRGVARELWRIQRLLLPYHVSGKFERPTDAKTFAARGAKLLERLAKDAKEKRPRAFAQLESARLWNTAENFAQAVATCQTVEKEAMNLPMGRDCAQLRASIQLPTIQIETYPVAPPAKKALQIKVRNIEKLTLRAIATNPDELTKATPRDSREDWGQIRGIDQMAMRAYLGRKAVKEWSFSPKYPAQYAPTTVTIDTPGLEAGLYVVFAANDDKFTPDQTVIEAAVLNVTKLFLFGSVGLPVGHEGTKTTRGYHLYALDAISGKPVKDANIDAYYRVNWQMKSRTKRSTDSNGEATFDLATGSGTSNSLDPLAKNGPSYAFWGSQLYYSRYIPPRIELHAELDRPIYRPGQKAKVKITVVERHGKEFRVYGGKREVAVTARDANGQEFYKASLKPNDLGSLTTSFDLPAGRLLGTWDVQAHLAESRDSFDTSVSFGVEEYKRPEFEVALEDTTDAWRYGHSAKIEGGAKYYFGGPVPGAKVSYRIVRQTYVPWVCWWWAWRRPDPAKEVAHGDVKADEKGHFAIPFTPEPGNKKDAEPLPSHYVVTIDSRDTGGRTITTTRTYVAGAKAYLFDVQLPGDFLTASVAQAVKVRAMNLNEAEVAAKGDFEVFRLEGAPNVEEAPDAKPEEEDAAPDTDSAGSVAALREPTLAKLYDKVPNGKRVLTGGFSSQKGQPASLDLNLPEGIYRLVVTANDPWGGKSESRIVLAVVGGETPALPLPGVTVVEHSKYKVGETARVLLGSSELTGNLFVEIWEGDRYRETKLIAGGVRVLSLPIADRDRGGLTVRWFGAANFKMRTGSVHVDVPWDDKLLALELPTGKSAKPGEKVSWTLTAKDNKGAPIDGEATLRVYDRSLEYYASGVGADWANGIYPASLAPEHLADSHFRHWATLIMPTHDTLAQKLGIPTSFPTYPDTVMPGLRSNRSRVYGMYERRRYANPRKMRGQEEMEGMAAAPTSAMAEPEADKATGGAGGASAKKMADDANLQRASAPLEQKASPGAPPPPPAPRKDFSETATFQPQIAISGGKGTVAFAFPEQLTSWRVGASVITKDLKSGSLSQEIATKKDLMVRVEMPRFFREGDHSQIQAVVHNETDAPFSGKVTLALEGPAGALVIGDTEKSFNVEAHGVKPLAFPVEAKTMASAIKVRVIARAGQLVDSEERELPVLPARERIVDSRLAWLDGKQKTTLKLADLKGDSKVESVSLQIDPQLALPILESLPFLVQYPFECAEQIANKYVPLAIVNAIFRKYPALAEAVKKIPPRKTVTKAWDAEDPRRAMTLMESPWLVESRGGPDDLSLVDMLNPRTVDAEKKHSLDKLASYQLASGAFPWFPGGHEDFYMTLYVLESFAHVLDFGIEPPEEMLKNAFEWAMREVPSRVKTHHADDVAYLLYASFVLTSFAEKYEWAKPALNEARGWMATAEKESRAMTPYGKAWAAWVFKRLGDTAKSEAYLARALDGSREDELTGLYWTPEKISWLWYTDTVEKHAFFLRTLLHLHPDDKRIAGMTKWLLFNRKGNEWKSTKASASAIYSLLDVMKKRGALDNGETFRWSWSGEQNETKVSPTEYFAKPLRWTKTDGASEAKVEKDGPGLAFVSLTRIFATDHPPTPSAGVLGLERKFFVRTREGAAMKLVPLRDGASVRVGDEIEVQLVVTAKAQFEYVHLKAPRGAGFEAEELLSGWKWEDLSRYEEQRDSLQNFFMNWLPHGEYVLRYRVRATTPGAYRFGPATLQSMYAPEFAAYAEGFKVEVK